MTRKDLNECLMRYKIAVLPKIIEDNIKAATHFINLANKTTEELRKKLAHNTNGNIQKPSEFEKPD